ncbi:MAG: acyl carrier protein phosphodiesterase [Bdellovibrionota bacterium]|jgi:acyl carrier protein phosphodiesterase
MNFLAHLTLSYFDTNLQAGNFLGDFVKGKAVTKLPAGVQRGIAMHRAIDAMTDTDPGVKSLNHLLSARHGRYAGVITDIGFDHFLCQNWKQFGPLEFDAFRVGTYWALHAHREAMSERVQGYIEGMLNHDWLTLYKSREGMAHVYGRLRPRLSKPKLLDGVNESLTEYHDEFNQTFLALFPRLQTLADAYRPNPT